MLLDDGFLKQPTLVSFLAYSWPLPNPLCPRFHLCRFLFNPDMFGHLPPPSARHSVRAPHHPPHQFQDHRSSSFSACPFNPSAFSCHPQPVCTCSCTRSSSWVHSCRAAESSAAFVGVPCFYTFWSMVCIDCAIRIRRENKYTIEVLNFAHCVYQVTKLLHHLRKDISALQSSRVCLFQDIRKRAMFLMCSCYWSVLHGPRTDQTVLLSVDPVVVRHCEKDVRQTRRTRTMNNCFEVDTPCVTKRS